MSQPEKEVEPPQPISRDVSADDKAGVPKKKRAVKKGRKNSKGKLEVPALTDEGQVSSDPSGWVTNSEADFERYQVPTTVRSVDLVNKKPNAFGLGGAYNA